MKTKEITDFRSKHTVLTEPLTKEELKELVGKRKSFKVLISLDELIKTNPTGFYVDMQKKIAGRRLNMLLDPTFEIAGRNASTNEAIIKVTAEIFDIYTED